MIEWFTVPLLFGVPHEDPRRAGHARPLDPHGSLVVAVEVEAVIPVDGPSEHCNEAETVQWLREVEQRAERGDVAWLQQHGKRRRGG